MFPGSYPLTAKTLLVSHGLIDLNEYNENKSRFAFVSNQGFSVTPTKAPQCDIDGTPKLKVYLLDQTTETGVKEWLMANNIAYRHSAQVNISKDMDTNLFNLTTGLPGLYRYVDTDVPLDINTIFKQSKISIQVHQHTFDIAEDFDKLTDHRVYLFYQPKAESLFYRTSAIFVGFEAFDEVPLSAQNMVASYIKNGLNCPSFVADNLIDSTMSEVDYNDVASNYSNGYFHLLYKDKTMLFNQGKLVFNKTFSTNKNVNEPMDIEAVYRAIEKINGRRAD